MEKLLLLVLGISVLWASGTLCLPKSSQSLEDRPSHNRTIRETQCNQDEYPFEERCCRMCPAGTYVADHCTKDHQAGLCQPCSLGEGFTVSANGLDRCPPCRICREEEDTEQACTLISNTICKCKPGRYCIPGEVCEICSYCSSCGARQRIKENCSAIKDTVCENIPITQPTSNTTRSYLRPTDATVTSTNSTPTIDVTKHFNSTTETDTNFWTHFPYIAVLVSVILIGAVIGCCYYCCKRRENEKKQRGSLDFLTNASRDPSANSSVTSTPAFLRVNQEVARQLQEETSLLMVTSSCDSTLLTTRVNQEGARQLPEAVELLASSKDQDSCNGVTQPTGHSGTQEPQSVGSSGPGKDDRGGGGGGEDSQEPCGDCDQLPPCDCYWRKCFHCIIDNVNPEDIFRLSRDLGVPGTKIDHIKRDNANNTYEQCYQLLEAWRKQKGKQASMKSVLDALQKTGLVGCVENIINSLKSKSIPTI